MEKPLHSFRQEQSKVTLVAEKYDGVSKKKHDWSLNKINYNKIPKLTIKFIKLNKKMQINYRDKK